MAKSRTSTPKMVYNNNMSLREQINADFKAAMLAHDEVKKVTLNGLKSAIKYKEVAKSADAVLNDTEIEAVVAHEVKSRNDSIALYEQAGDTDRADKEKAERDILSAYLPKQLSADELKAKVAEIITNDGFEQKDFGRIMGECKKQIGNAAEGSAIAAAVKAYFA